MVVSLFPCTLPEVLSVSDWFKDCKLCIGITANHEQLHKPLLFNIFALEKPREFMVLWMRIWNSLTIPCRSC